MYKSLVIVYIFFMFFMLSACSVEPLKPVAVEEVKQRVDYIQEIQPILNKRCVVCHSCYNSPCQLKLSSYEGADRGTSKEKIYFGERLFSADPTRLFMDAKNTQEWRKKGFNTVLESTSAHGTNNSLMLQLLNHKMKNPKSEGEYFSESDELVCARDEQELSEFLDDNPNQGMPFGFPPLKENEFKSIKQWLAQGAPASTKEQEGYLKIPSQKAATQIEKFEQFFNNPHAKYVMSARYIYEHLYLAHISFKSSPNEFFELVRSSTPSAAPIEIIPTIRPYDDPKVEKFYYRFRKIHSTIVHKTHMVYTLDDTKLQRYHELFIEPQWEEVPHVLSYQSEYNANPLRVFTQIPAKSRYRFLLDDAHYMIMTFIRGPVCKGQIALNVINEQFWVMFMNPEYDLSIQNKDFLKQEYENTALPVEGGRDTRLYKIITQRYNDLAIHYNEDRQKLYDASYPNGLGLESIWRGDNNTSVPFLTVYRHFESASVDKGALGGLPKTVLVLDYPLFERMYYTLVAGFDVYGNIGHQVAIRRYMDRLRVEGESNFLNLLPKEERKTVFDSWYIDAQDDEKVFFSKNETAIEYKTNDSKRELLERIVDKHLLKSCKIKFDKMNYYRANEKITKLPKVFKTKNDLMDGFKSLVKPGTPFIRLVNGNGSNLAYIRVKIPHAEDVVISVVVNRWHDNVAFMFDESGRLDAAKDDFDFIDGFIGSYPNFFLVVQLKDLPDFFDMMHNYDGSDIYKQKFLKYGISRADPDFWEQYDWFQEKFNKQDPHEAGLFDLNRYYYKVLR